MAKVDKSPTRERIAAPSSSSINVSMLSSMGIAIAIHAVLALAVGSYVVFEGIVPVPFFNSEGIDVSTQSPLIEETPTLIEEEPLPQVQSENVQVVEEAGGSDAPDMSDLITVSNSTLAPSFSMPTTAGNPGLISGNLFGSAGSGSGTGVGKGKIKLGSLFGSKNLGAGVLTGYFYDFKQTRDKKPNSEYHYGGILGAFIKDWDTKILEPYFKAETPLSITQFIMPDMKAGVAPAAFEVEKEVMASGWMAHYSGKITPPHSGTFRFVGLADNVIIVAVDQDVVFNGSLGGGESDVRKILAPSHRPDRKMFAGKWMRMRAGKIYPIEVVIGEIPGGDFGAFLMVQEKNAEYETHPAGYPILPPFQMMPTEIPKYEESKGFKVLDDGLIFGAE